MLNFKYFYRNYKIFIFILNFLLLNNLIFANDLSDEGVSEDFIENTKDLETTNLKSKISYPEYQVEIILFKNNMQESNKEIFYQDLKEPKKSNSVDFNSKYVDPKFLLKDYTKLKGDKNYQVIFYSAAKYSLPFNQRNRKFFIQNETLDDPKIKSDFKILLNIFHIKNNINLIFDGNFEKFSLNKVAKIKSKETYYFDHPMFGALITVVDLNKYSSFEGNP